jgi:hypothetical protein
MRNHFKILGGVCFSLTVIDSNGILTLHQK